jgi:hypothetical protein
MPMASRARGGGLIWNTNKTGAHRPQSSRPTVRYVASSDARRTRVFSASCLHFALELFPRIKQWEGLSSVGSCVTVRPSARTSPALSTPSRYPGRPARATESGTVVSLARSTEGTGSGFPHSLKALDATVPSGFKWPEGARRRYSRSSSTIWTHAIGTLTGAHQTIDRTNSRI